MRKSTKFLSALAVAGMIAASGSAFTASQPLTDAYVGYGENTTSGVTVTNIAYNVSTTDASKLASIVFTVTENVSSGYDAVLTINGSTSTQITCDATVAGTITCSTSADVANVDSIGLTVTAHTS